LHLLMGKLLYSPLSIAHQAHYPVTSGRLLLTKSSRFGGRPQAVLSTFLGTLGQRFDDRIGPLR
jgi:hypothetical protein